MSLKDKDFQNPSVLTVCSVVRMCSERAQASIVYRPFREQGSATTLRIFMSYVTLTLNRAN